VAERPGVLGVSHLVLAQIDFDAVEGMLAAQGWRRLVDLPTCDNAEGKAPFVAAPMSAASAMRLLAGPPGLPAVELIAEGDGRRAAAAQPAFSWRYGGEPPAATATVTVECRGGTREAALRLWRDIGLDAAEDGDGAATITIPRTLVGAGATLRLVESPEAAHPTWLDQSGLVCVSFFVTAAEPLRRLLEERGYEVGEMFTVAPLGRPMDVFFVRGAAGELYEFLSSRPHKST
jgi:hypothetical protein